MDNHPGLKPRPRISTRRKLWPTGCWLSWSGHRCMHRTVVFQRISPRRTLSELMGMRPDPDRWDEQDFWLQYAQELELHETHTNTDPWILCLPQPHPTFGGKTTDQQFSDFLERFSV